MRAGAQPVNGSLSRLRTCKTCPPVQLPRQPRGSNVHFLPLFIHPPFPLLFYLHVSFFLILLVIFIFMSNEPPPPLGRIESVRVAPGQCTSCPAPSTNNVQMCPSIDCFKPYCPSYKASTESSPRCFPSSVFPLCRPARAQRALFHSPILPLRTPCSCCRYTGVAAQVWAKAQALVHPSAPCPMLLQQWRRHSPASFSPPGHFELKLQPLSSNLVMSWGLSDSWCADHATRAPVLTSTPARLFLVM